ncbi:peptidase S28 [Lentinus tigrinus ALCF2SS1-7]|uniref:Peptidase S28 n=1 Tax=Lentinus tigrinus ALCF2SS1-6 TaxID=1328759 RepID=A0A5C2SHJ0_9APHY|nr:peptidase S28 [Lentinus tigrinus ALCF2SS1-6]RPD77672.1 peptidase S28 [Lentinus tigrinus ALCF2SS1-7]
MVSTIILLVSILVSSVTASQPLLSLPHARPHIPYTDEPDASVSVFHQTTQQQISSYGETFYFDQLIDHDNPSLGTFKQRYWHNYEFYDPGGTIVLLTPGEINAEGFTSYLTNTTITGMIAQATNGATIVLEHRFFGKSNPYPDLSVKSLRVHTIEQAINDLEYFAKNVHLPMPGGDAVSPGKAPWILVGGSYSGALVSFTMHSKPGLFYAGYASSAVIQAIGHFWKYYEPIREYMPKNCSADVEAVIAHIDAVLDTGNATAIHDVKAVFGLEDIVHDDDFGSALATILGSWQDGDITTRSDAFYDFCDALEVDNGKSAPASGWGLNHTLQAWGQLWKDTYYPATCGTFNAEDCFGTHDPNKSWWNNVTLSDDRSWTWMTCNQFGFFQVGADSGTQPVLVSRHYTAASAERNCLYDFPGAFKGSRRLSILNALGVNTRYGGWNVTTDRLIFANGHRDPWREATVAASGAVFSPTELQPHLVSDGFHCSDLLGSEAASSHVKAVQDAALDYMKKWYAEWKPSEST